jgi:capsular exopolysaccharide synthesis family protein
MVGNQTPGTGLPPREVHLRDYWKVVWAGRYTAAAVFLVVVAATAVYTFLQTPIYRAVAVVEVQSQPRKLAPGQDVSGLGVAGYGWWAEEKYHNTQVEIIRSRDVAQRAFATLGLAYHPTFENAADPEDIFRRMIQVDPRRDTGLVEISMIGTDRDEITRWVNAVADAYVERNLEKAQENVQLAVGSIRERIKPLQSELSLAEQKGFEMLAETEIFDPESQKKIVNDKLTNFNATLNHTQIELGDLRNRLDKIRQVQARGADPLTLPDLAEDPVLKDLKQQQLALERELEGARVTLRPGHPDFEKKRGELNKVEQKIDEHVGLIVSKLENQYSYHQKKEESLKKQIEHAEQTAFHLGKATARYDITKTDTETKKQLYDLVNTKMHEVQLATGLLANNVSVLDHAMPPLHPIKPRKRLNLMMGAVMGMFLGVGLVFFLDYLDNTFRTPQDIEKYLGLSVLGVIPKFQPGDKPSRTIKEANQSLRTSVIFSSKNRRRKVVLVTSTGPQEGKSLTVANLARSLASAGDRAMVLDCDLRRPTQHLHHETTRDRGLTNYLAAPQEDTDWMQYVRPVSENLFAIPCGPIPPSPPELLGAERFRALLAELREAYDWVLIDSPPSASLADSTILATLADMVVLVVRHNHTDRDLVMRNVQQLRALENVALVGAVLNNVDIDRASSRDYYYAGYYYYYAEDGQKERGKRKSEARPKTQAG